MKNKINIIDCTLRDGGYYNNWNFDLEIIKNYLKAVSQTSIDIVEIGFRFTKSNQNLGPLAYSNDNYLNKVNALCFNI